LNDLKTAAIWPTVDLCYHSGLQRTRQTASILFAEAPMIELTSLREFDFGDFELKNYDELKDNPAYIHWISQIMTEQCPNGDSREHFHNRVLAGWAQVLAARNNKQDPPIAVVTHGGVIATVMNELFPDQKHFYEWQLSCGSGYQLEIQQGQVIGFSEICAITAAGNY
jgi:alpha-ribazole phosphatase